MPAPVGVIASSHWQATVPQGWVDIPATASNALRQQPDDNPVIDDLSITCRVALNAVPGTGNRTICERWVTSSSGVNRFIARFDGTARPALLYAQGGVTQTKQATVAWPFAAAQWGWLRIDFTRADRDGNTVTKFLTSVDGTTFTVLDTLTGVGAGSIDGGAGSLAVGNRWFGSALGLNGKLADLIIRNVTSTIFEMHTDTDLRGVAVAAASFPVTSGQTVNVLRSGSPALVLVPPP